MDRLITVLPKRCHDCIPETCYQTGNKYCTIHPKNYYPGKKPTGEKLNIVDFMKE